MKQDLNRDTSREASDEDRSWNEKFRVWLFSEDAASLGVSFLVHAILLAICSFVVIQNMQKNKPLTTIVSEADEEGVELDESPDVQLDLAGIEQEKTPLPQYQQLPVPTQMTDWASMPPDLEASVTALASSIDGKDDGGAAGTGFHMPASGKVVRRGSFAAWTIPEDPKPQEDYLIVIQVKLPRRIRNYSSRDLTGFMRGTDGYKTPIGYSGGRYYGKFNLKARQLVIKIPGAQANVRDTIHVESHKLREKQDLEIVF